MRRAIASAIFFTIGLSLISGHAATPDHGEVVVPAAPSHITKPFDGPKLSWMGASFTVAANASTSCDESDPCDIFHLSVHPPAGYWGAHKGNVVVHIFGYDANQDFDLRVYRENPDGSRGARVATSGGPAGAEEKALIPEASGTYMVIVFPFHVTNSGYSGEAYVQLRPDLPSVTSPPGQQISRASHDKYLSHSEPSIAMNPLNHDNLVAGSKMYTDLGRYRFKIGTYYSLDGGRTWSDNGHLPGYPEDDDNYITSDISMAFDDEGNAYAFVLDSAADHSGMNVHISHDGGKTWSGPIVVHSTPDPLAGTPAEDDLGVYAVLFDDKNWITVDNSGADHDGAVGTIYTCWNLDVETSAIAEEGTVVVSRSTDAGQSWSPPLPLNAPPQVQPGLPGDSVIGCQVVVDPRNGDVYVFWMDYANAQVRFARSTNHGQTFSLPAKVDDVTFPRLLPNTQFRNPDFPSAGIGPDGTISVVWQDGRFADDHNADVGITRSTDGGASWSALARVNDDTQGHDQVQPWLAVTPKGQLNVFFFDRRNDPNNIYLDAYIARSDDGTHWKNIRVTPAMWDPYLNPPISGSGSFIGDYQGIVADDSVAIPFWNDTRSGQYQEVYSARVANGPVAERPAAKPPTKVLGKRATRLPATGVGNEATGYASLAVACLLALSIRRRREV